MNFEKRANYLLTQIQEHVKAFYPPQALEALPKIRIVFIRYRDAVRLHQPTIAIPVDINAPLIPERAYQVPFGATKLTLWNPLPAPEESGWRKWPDDACPVWYRHESGTLIPAWNLFANLFDLLTFREDREISTRDQHQRLIASFSPRLEKNLLEVPAFNEAVALLVSAATQLTIGGDLSPAPAISPKPPAIVLSHDCDVLLGNDRWTQSVRLARIGLPVLHGKLPRVANIWWSFRNAFRPRDFYFDNLTGMILLERLFGYISTIYFLNGARGRFRARSNRQILQELAALIPDDWQKGMHYNYGTLLNEKAFISQSGELSEIIGAKPVTGRAHYLRFDGQKSLSFLESFGIRCDESAGYPDRVGYRCGIAGAFRAYDVESEKTRDIWEVPMTIMEKTLLDQYGPNAVAVFDRMLAHLSEVGGALTLVFHPGNFFNPEFPEMLGYYHHLLLTCRKYETRSITALSLTPEIDSQSLL